MKEKEMKRVPKLRFPEFTDDWEQRKLGELTVEFKSGDSIKADKITNIGTYPVYGGNGIRGYTETYNHDGEFALIGRQGALCGNMNFSHGKAYFTEHAVAVKANFANDTQFLFYMLKNMNLGQYSGQSAQPGLAVNKLVELYSNVPEKSEQQQIGTYFKQLDHLITLHQRKLEKLKELKKGLVQKLFSQEVRFKADDGSEFPEWEEKKLGDVTSQYKVRNKKRLPLEIYSVNNIVGFIPQSEQFDDAGYLKDTDTSIYMVVPPKHFAYNPARLDIGSIGFQCLDHDVQVSSLYEVFETSDLVNDRFLWSWFHTYYFNNVVKRLQEGGVRLYFYYDKMQEVKIRLPSLPEQQKIADCLSSLDDGIAKQKATLAAWEELKKGLLQQMFV